MQWAVCPAVTTFILCLASSQSSVRRWTSLEITSAHSWPSLYLILCFFSALLVSYGNVGALFSVLECKGGDFSQRWWCHWCWVCPLKALGKAIESRGGNDKVKHQSSALGQAFQIKDQTLQNNLACFVSLKWKRSFIMCINTCSFCSWLI